MHALIFLLLLGIVPLEKRLRSLLCKPARRRVMLRLQSGSHLHVATHVVVECAIPHEQRDLRIQLLGRSRRTLLKVEIVGALDSVWRVLNALIIGLEETILSTAKSWNLFWRDLSVSCLLKMVDRNHLVGAVRIK